MKLITQVVVSTARFRSDRREQPRTGTSTAFSRKCPYLDTSGQHLLGGCADSKAASLIN